MADNTSVIKIQYDTDEAIKKIDELGVAIDANKKRQKELKNQLENNEISQKQYNKQLAETTETLGRETFERKKYIKVVQSEVGSIKRAKTENQVLREERNKLNLTTVEGRKKLEEYNRKINSNTDIIKGNVDEQSKLYMSLGNIKENLSSIPGPLGGVIDGIGGMTKAALAFIATPFGAILAAIVGTVTLLVKAFKRSESRMAKLKVIGAQLGGVFKGIQKVLEPLVDFIVDNVIVAFEKMGKAVEKTISFVERALRKVGWEKAADGVKEYSDRIAETAKQAGMLAEKEQELVEAQREAGKIQLDYQKDAEKLRQIRDDEAKSIEKRIEANEKLGQVLQEQLNTELAIAQKQLEVANLRIQVEGETTSALDERAAALENIADIEERITGQQSEQLVNINSLRKEQADWEASQLEAHENTLKRIEREDEARGVSIMSEAERQTELLNQKLANDEKLRQYKAEQDELEFIRNEMMLDQAFTGMQDIISATRDFANQRVNILTDAFSKIATINFKEVKSAKDGFIAIGNAARGLTELIISGNQAQLDDLEAKKQAELEAYVGADEGRQAIEKRYNDKAVKLKKAQAKEDKRKAIVDATIATIVAVTNALKQGEFPQNVILAGVMGVLGGIQVALIGKQQIPEFSSNKVFADGGAIVNGPSHASGGVDVWGSNGQYFGNVEGNEGMYVMKKDATAEIAAMSAINESYGGRSFFDKPIRHAQEGGELDAGNIGRAVQEEIQRTPVVVKVGDIETGLTEYGNVKEAGVI